MLYQKSSIVVSRGGCRDIHVSNEELLDIIMPELTSIKTVFLQALSKLRQELEPRIAVLESQWDSIHLSRSPRQHHGDNLMPLAKQPRQGSDDVDRKITAESGVQPSRSFLAEAASPSLRSEETAKMASPRLAPWPACALMASSTAEEAKQSVPHQPSRMDTDSPVSSERPCTIAENMEESPLRPKTPSPNNSRNSAVNTETDASFSSEPCRRPSCPQRSSSFSSRPSVSSVDDEKLERQDSSSSDCGSARVTVNVTGSPAVASLSGETGGTLAGAGESCDIQDAMGPSIQREPCMATKLTSHQSTFVATRVDTLRANPDGTCDGDATSAQDPSVLAENARVNQLDERCLSTSGAQGETVPLPSAEIFSSAGAPQDLGEPSVTIRKKASDKALAPRSKSAPLTKRRVMPPYGAQIPSQAARVGYSGSMNVMVAAHSSSAYSAVHQNSALQTGTAMVTLARKPTGSPCGTACASPPVPCVSTSSSTPITAPCGSPRCPVAPCGSPCASPAVPCVSTSSQGCSTPITAPCGSSPCPGPGLLCGAPGAAALRYQKLAHVPYVVFPFASP